MIEQYAIILATDSTTDNTSTATIEVVRKTACGLCGQTQGCGNAFWGKLFAHKASSFKAQNTINAQVGQTVIVGIDESAVMKSALVLYLVPLVTMLFGAILAGQMVDGDIGAIVGAVIGLIVGYFWIKAHIAGREYYQQHQPKILRLDRAGAATDAIQFELK
ncbi:MAG: SoxR reducing system RseC family protein [Methylophilaceae bacterium]|jgi:sigma-E factor negative regulatory protein RseC|nr:MAG: SoxR reducing system RseC family protein [Methylophilaceae bacterium]